MVSPLLEREREGETRDEANQGQKRSTFHDELGETTFWPAAYDGRAIVTDSYRDHTSGLSLDENRAKLKAATDVGDHSRQLCWAYVFFFISFLTCLSLLPSLPLF